MATIASLSINIGAKVSDLTAGLKTAGNSVDAFYAKVGSKVSSMASPITGAVKGIGEIGKALGGLASSAVAPLSGIASGIAGIASAAATGLGAVVALGAAVAAAGAVALGAIAAMTSGGMDRIDKLGDSAQRIGTSTKALSELRYAADLTGSSADDLDSALEKLNTNLGDSATKATPTSTALARLGLDAKELAKVSPDEAFKKIVGGFEKVPDAATKASLAMDIFGKGGIKILNTLSAGGAQLESLAAEARKFGVSIDDVDQAKIGAAKDALDRAGASIEGVGNTLAIKLAPFIELVANNFADWFAGVMDGGKLVESAMGGIAQGVAAVAQVAADVAGGVLDVFSRIVSGAASAMEALGIGSDRVRKAADGLRQASEAAAALNPGEKVLAFYEGIKTKAAEAATAVAKTAAENRGLGNTFETLAGSISEVTSKLKEQVDTFGKSAGEIELYKLAQMGASEAQLAGVRSLSDQLTALDKQKKDYEELKGSAKGFFDATRTPLEKYQAEIEKAGQALASGLIDRDTFNRAGAKASEDLRGKGEPKFAGALELGSKEARSAILAATTGRGGGVERNTQTIAGNTAATNGLLKRLIDAMPGGASPDFTIA